MKHAVLIPHVKMNFFGGKIPNQAIQCTTASFVASIKYTKHVRIVIITVKINLISIKRGDCLIHGWIQFPIGKYHFTSLTAGLRALFQILSEKCGQIVLF